MKQNNLFICLLFCLCCRTSGDIIHIHWNSLWSSSYHRNGADLVRCVYHLITDFQIKNKMILLNIFKEEQDEKEK